MEYFYQFPSAGEYLKFRRTHDAYKYNQFSDRFVITLKHQSYEVNIDPLDRFVPTEDEIKKLKDAAAAQLKVTEAKLEEQRRAADEQCRAAVKAEEVRKAATKAATKQAILKHYQLQAEGGDGFAQMRLGEIYFRGDGIETNIILARKWLSTASTNGYPQVTNLLSEIEANLRPK